jgi:hypothetical protein
MCPGPTPARLFQTDFYASQKMRSRVSGGARLSGSSSDNRRASLFVRQTGLYHTGRFGYDLFAWPQSIKALL